MDTIFSIHLIEDEAGFITVKSDHVGLGFNSLYLGMDLLRSLAELEQADSTILTVQAVEHSNARQ